MALLALAIPALGTWLAANRPRLGREEISHLVGEIGAINARDVLRDAFYGNRQTTVMADIELVRMADLVFERISARMRGEDPTRLYPPPEPRVRTIPGGTGKG